MADRFEWSAVCSVGDEILDGQHRKIIDVLNTLYGILVPQEGNPSQATAQDVFAKLTDFVVEHFSYEEKRMEAAGFPEDQLMDHRRIHNEMIAQIQAYEDAVNGGDAQALEELLPFLYGGWLLDHICGKDQEYAPYLGSQQT